MLMTTNLFDVKHSLNLFWGLSIKAKDGRWEGAGRVRADTAKGAGTLAEGGQPSSEHKPGKHGKVHGRLSGTFLFSHLFRVLIPFFSKVMNDTKSSKCHYLERSSKEWLWGIRTWVHSLYSSCFRIHLTIS